VVRHHLFRSLKLARPLAHTHAPQEGDIKLTVNTPVVITASWRDSPLLFKRPKVFWRTRKAAGRLTDMKHKAVHIGLFTGVGLEGLG
jgi:hypothetical protein